ARKAAPQKAPRTAQVAAAPRFRGANQFRSIDTDTAAPKSVTVAGADPGKRKVDLSILGSKASASERKPATASPAKTRKVRIASLRAKAPEPGKVIVTRTAYAVQVGAHAQLALAQRSAKKALRTLPRNLRQGVQVAVMKPATYKGRYYRARIVGLSKANAAAACRYLKKKSLRCLTVRTGRRIQVAAATPSRPKAVTNARPPRRAASSRGDYVVQVGAVTRYSNARRLARKARRSLPRTLSRHTTERILAPGSYKGRLYRVRLAGLSQSEAQTACRILKSRSVRCLPMRDRPSHVRHAAVTGDRYAVQIGAVTAPSKARRLIRKARRTLPRNLRRQARARVLSPATYDGRFYRARLTGLSRMEATRACKILRRESLNCLPYRVDDADA
ncbi:MAG: SPOR domain-containing protein, partial [Bauldia litoralis]